MMPIGGFLVNPPNGSGSILSIKVSMAMRIGLEGGNGFDLCFVAIEYKPQGCSGLSNILG